MQSFAGAAVADFPVLSFERTAQNCGLCGGAGVVPDARQPTELKPCPRCAPDRPRRPKPRPDEDLEDVRGIGDIAWHALIALTYVAIGLLTVVMGAILVAVLFG